MRTGHGADHPTHLVPLLGLHGLFYSELYLNLYLLEELLITKIKQPMEATPATKLSISHVADAQTCEVEVTLVTLYSAS
jgi:hypothetical protein